MKLFKARRNGEFRSNSIIVYCISLCGLDKLFQFLLFYKIYFLFIRQQTTLDTRIQNSL